MPVERSLADWLAWQETLSSQPIVLGLDRVREVAQRMGLARPAPIVINVAGTNGKGSSVALFTSILRCAGYRVGSYTSPHLLRYNERICINGVMATDEQICAAFSAIEHKRADVPLTYFEFGTLAALWIFAHAKLDAAVLEIGLGGRLDAVNMIDPDLALITNIGLDHTDWLGPDRESIGREKAGILRPWVPAVCADPNPPASIDQHASALGTQLMYLGRDFGLTESGTTWDWRGWDFKLAQLPKPGLAGRHQLRNAAGVIAGLRLLTEQLPVERASIEQGLLEISLPGRFEREPLGPAQRILDVAHNLESVLALAENLRQHPVRGKTIALFSALADKPTAAMVEVLLGLVDKWHFAGMPGLPRGLEVQTLAARIGNIVTGVYHVDVAAAYRAAITQLHANDRLVIFGSFHTIEQVRRFGDE